MRQSRDRGQVLLVGAIAIAFVFLALIAVFNGVVYTETAASSAASPGRAPAEATTHGLVDGVERLVTSAWDEETGAFDDGSRVRSTNTSSSTNERPQPANESS